jgi:hypothetical protein
MKSFAMTNCFVKNPFAQRVKVQYLKSFFINGSYRSTKYTTNESIGFGFTK